jgi:hypothetical protein
MPHGFMSARADFKDEAATKEYVDGYQMTVDFFNEHL